MLLEFIKALFLIFVAELGDKSQILAMVFATKYKVRYVLFGVFVGALLNHSLAVILGTYLSDVIPLGLIQLLAGLLFVFFGIWSLKLEDDEEGEDVGEIKYGPILTVAFAFFIGELGDKTQLATITLSTETSYPLVLLCGTVSGMVLTGAIGIWIGRKLGDKIPELILKIVSAIVFIFFGSLKLYDILPGEYTTMPILIVYFSILGSLSYVLIKKNIEADRDTRYKKAAKRLFEYTHQIKDVIDDICIGCDMCLKSNCVIGYTKEIINIALESDQKGGHEYNKNKTLQFKDFDKKKAINGLALTLDCIQELDDFYSKDFVIQEVRQALELILLQKSIKFDGTFEDYIQKIKEYDKEIARELKDRSLSLD